MAQSREGGPGHSQVRSRRSGKQRCIVKILIPSVAHYLMKGYAPHAHAQLHRAGLLVQEDMAQFHEESHQVCFSGI